jgi:hypothetical protein
LIAAGLSPLEPERQLISASRIFLHEIEEHIVCREDFAFDGEKPVLVFEQRRESRHSP